MLRGIDFIVFSDDWGRHPCSCQHLFTQLLPNNRVLWVNTIMRNPKVRPYDLKRSFGKVRGWLTNRRGQPCLSNPTLLSPLMLPFGNFGWIRVFNRRNVLNKIREAQEILGLKNPVLLTTLPTSADFVGRLGESLSIYYCIDDYLQFSELDIRFIARVERDLINRADLLVASSTHLCRIKSLLGKSFHFLPHGVDFDHFQPCSLLRVAPVESEFMKIKKPIIGFFGLIGPWVDLDLLAFLAKRRPDYSVVLMGPSKVSLGSLRNMPNVFITGPKPYESLPAYASRFDVAIIPFKVNKLTASVNPLKLLEYSAMGLPVVSTPMGDTRENGSISIAESYDEFLKAVDSFLLNDTEEERRRRIEVARLNSWRIRAETLSKWISDLLI